MSGSNEIPFSRIVGLIGRPDPVILDVGANLGQHSSLFLRHFPGATLHSFEPDPRAVAGFRARIDNPRVTLHEIALGAEDGEATFHMSDGAPPDQEEQYPEGFHMAGSLRKPKNALVDWPWLEFRREITVPVVKLDTWSRDNRVERIDFIWADVQGAESDLIQGGAETLARTRFFYTEYSDREWYDGQAGLDQLAALLPDFDLVARTDMDVLFANRRLAD